MTILQIKKMLLLSVKSQMSIRGEGGFSEQEVYRLKEIALRLKQELSNDEDSLLIYVSLLKSKVMASFKVSSLNLNGARDVKKRAYLFETLKLKKMNIMMLQETHSDVFNETDWRREFEGQVILSHFNNMSAGVALLFSRDVVPLSHVV